MLKDKKYNRRKMASKTEIDRERGQRVRERETNSSRSTHIQKYSKIYFQRDRQPNKMKREIKEKREKREREQDRQTKKEAKRQTETDRLTKLRDS